jgi:hypothetical protein
MALITGSIKLVPTNTEPTSAKGVLYYNDTEERLKHYDGSNWINVDTSGVVFTAGGNFIGDGSDG